MGRDHAEVFFFYPLFKSNDIFCHIPYGFHRCTAFDIKSIQNILCFRTDRVFICDMIGNGPHFLPVELFGIEAHTVVEVCLIDIQIHHARIRTANLCDIGIAESSADLCCAAPLCNLFCHVIITAFYHTSDNSMTFSGTLQVCYHLTDCATRIQLAEPFRGIGICIVRRFQFLYIDQDNRYV